MAAESTRTTMTIIALALFGGDPRLISEESMRHIAAAIEGFSEARMLALLRLPQFPITPKGRAGKRGQVFLRRTLAEVVDDRWHGRVAGDFLTGMIDALRQRFPEDEARALAVDNAATFYLAGHETTANALSWTLYPASRTAGAAGGTCRRSARAAVDGGEEAERLTDRLPRLRLFLRNRFASIRPYRASTVRRWLPDRIGDAEVEPGDIVSIWPWLLHRHSKLWDDPDGFDIDRFADKGGRHRFQYLPFGAGGREPVSAHSSQPPKR